MMIRYSIKSHQGYWNVYSSDRNNFRILSADKEAFSQKTIVSIITANHMHTYEMFPAEIKMEDGTIVPVAL
jgi:hypothetical protein